MKFEYDICILGSTALAAGFAEANPGLAIVILDERMTPAPEFAASLKYSPKLSEPETPGARGLYDELIRRGAVNDDVWQPAVAPIIAGRLDRLANADAYFFAALTKVDSIGGGYEISFTSYGREHSFKAKKLLDTTSGQLSKPYFGFADSFRKLLGCYTATGNSAPKLRTVSCDDSIAAAREKLITGGGDPVLLFASEPEYVFDTPGEGILRHSAYYPDPVAAFEAGELLAYDSLPTPAARTPDPIDDGEYDIIVAGLGTAGAIAASVAAGEGMKVLGLEALELQGGSGTAGGVLGYYFGFKGGVYREFDRRAGEIPGIAPAGGVGACTKAIELDRESALAGVDRRYGALVTGAMTDGRKVCGVSFSENGMIHTARARYVIDTTADAIVCVAAGAELQGGRSFDGRFQPYSSVCFKTDYSRLMYGYIDNGRVDQYDPDDFGRAVLGSASCYLHLRADYSDRKYLGIAPLIGLREGLRPIGEENVNFPDIVEGRFSSEPVCYGRSNLDNHGKDPVFEDRAYQDMITVCGLWGYGIGIPLPMGALIPKDWEGILTAGRSVAVDHDIAMGMRMKDDCQKSGEAAARLAVLSISSGVRAREVDLSMLRGQLAASGCLGNDDRLLLERQKSDEIHEYPLWCTDAEELARGLGSDAPGYYIRSVRAVGGAETAERLLGSENRNERWHAALALAITDESRDSDGRVGELLLECAQSRDGFVPKNGRKYINLRSISAISAIAGLAENGRLTDPGSAAKILTSLLNCAGDIASELPFEPYDLICDRGDLRFQYESHLISALAAIGRAAEGELSDRIRSTLAEFFTKADSDGRRFEVTLMGTAGFRLDCTERLKKLAGI